MPLLPLPNGAFDFEKHRQHAVEGYHSRSLIYLEYLEEMKDILSKALIADNIKATIDGRVKSVDSFARKAIEPDKKNPDQPKYKEPLNEIQDTIGLRVITFFLETIQDVDAVIRNQFIVHEYMDKAEALKEEERFGYQSVHYIVSLKENRTILTEYEKYKSMVAEIQVRTALQHTWAEIEHDIQYKSVESIPAPLRRRFMVLAGLFELVDRELNELQSADEERKIAAQQSVQQGNLDRIEITPDSLKIYLDERVGTDGRMTPLRYDEAVRLVKQLGFNDLRQIDKCIEKYDADTITRLIWNARLGQQARFEALLLAGMGEYFIEKYPNKSQAFIDRSKSQLAVLKRAGILIGKFKPTNIPANEVQ